MVISPTRRLFSPVLCYFEWQRCYNVDKNFFNKIFNFLEPRSTHNTYIETVMNKDTSSQSQIYQNKKICFHNVSYNTFECIKKNQ